MAPQPEPHDNENWRYGPNTIMVNIRNIVDPTMTHILGALLKARNENVSLISEAIGRLSNNVLYSYPRHQIISEPRPIQ